MRILEILLPKGTSDRSLSPQQARKIDALQKRMDGYVDKIMSPGTSAAGKEFLKSKLRSDYKELKDEIGRVMENDLKEAIKKLPLTTNDFNVVKKMMEKPIPAIIAPIYIMEIIEDDELNDQLASLEESEPNRDVRPLVMEWFKRVMPDQMYRFGQEVAGETIRKGILSPIHGYDSKSYKGSSDPVSGNAYGMF